MKKHYLLLLSMLLLAVASVQAAMFSTSPNPLQQSSKDVKIYFDPAQCDVAALKTASEIYAHIGVTLPSAPSSWVYVVGDWADKQAKKKFVKQSDGRWMLNIGEIDTYFNLPAGTKVAKIAIIALNAAGSSQTGDVYLDVAEEGYAMSLTSNPEDLVISKATNFTFTVGVTEPSTITIKVGDQVIGTASNATTLTKSHNFATQGTFNEVTATATNGKETLTKSLTVAYPSASTAMNYPGGVPKQGAIRQADGSVLFCIAAPSKTSAILVGSWDDFKTLDKNVMKYQDYNGYRYFWTRVEGLADRQYHSYYYLLDGVTKVADPYAKLILDPYSDKWLPSGIWNEPMPQYPYEKIDGVMLAVYRSDLDDYKWDSATTNFKVPDHNSMVIYELLFRDFTGDGSDQDGKHFGTISEAREKISYLKELGINCVELMPVMEFNGNNSWGYNPNFYFAPDKAYGTPDNYRLLIDECHSRGLAVILDVVFNQSDGLHPWYQMYPISKNPLYNGSAPHSYSVLNDWKQEHPLVEKQWNDVLAYWLTEYRVDGFRFDLVKGLGDDDSYGNTYDAATNMWGNPNEANTNCYNATRVARMKRLCDNMRKINPNAYCINENLATAKEENEMAADGEINWANINNSSCQFAMGYESDASLNRFYAPFDQRDWGSTISYAESHDEERMAYKQSQWGVDGVKGNLETSMRRLGSVGAQMLMAPGAHMIWQFQEFGADQTTKNSGGNDTSPKKVIWSYLDNPDRNGLMQNYSELCRIRANYPEMFEKDVTTSVELSSWNASSISLTKGDKAIYLYVNPSVTSSARIPSVADMSSTGYALLSSSYNTTPSANAGGVLLDPGAYAVYGTTNLTAVEMPESDSVTVRVEGNNIIVEGVEAEDTYVYTLEGIKVAPTFLPTGIYIVYLPDGHAVKVAIR